MSMASKRKKLPSGNKAREDSRRLSYVTGDLFSCPEDQSMAHCISQDCRMPQGIAAKFKKKFKGVAKELKELQKLTGQCAVLEKDGRFDYYLVTKEAHDQEPKYDAIQRSLEDMKRHCLSNKVTRISMPRIGCELDLLEWDRVSDILEQVFKDTDVFFTVYSLPEKEETKTPEYTPRLNYITGDLFACPEDHSMAHCISQDCVMSKGIAVKFRNKFKGVDDLWNQNKKKGQCAVLERGGRFVYYLMSKEKYNDKPTYDDLKASLEDMKSHCVSKRVTKISMPCIGCGLDHLQWHRVAEILEEVFKDTHVSFMVYTFPEREFVPPSGQTPEDTERLKYITGDLFACPEDQSMAHCISKDCRMGKGIATFFKKKFEGVDDLLKQNKKKGECAVLERNRRYIYYLMTKDKPSETPTYDDLKASLEDMKSHCESNGVTKISMPRIGCGLDNLEWDKVAEILEEVFKGTNITITVYTLPQREETKVAKGNRWK